MKYWLVKSEPDEYSYDKLVEDGKTDWVGVRNYQARNFMREMQLDDLVFYYHSRKGLDIVGLAKVIQTAYPDPTAKEGSDWSAVDLTSVMPLNRPVPLKAIKENPIFEDFLLVKSPRLSVMPVSEAVFMEILRMGESRLAF